MKVSVCMATYNGSRFLRQQVDSILVQLQPDDELIVSDDGSCDDTVSVLESYTDNRIKILQHEHTGSPTINFEKCMTQCVGEAIFLSDQDDIWAPNKVSVTLKHLQHYDLVVTDCSIINDHNTVVMNSFFDFKKSRHGIAKNLIRNSYMGCCMAFTRNVLTKILPFPANLKAHDQWIGLLSERYFKVYFLNQALVYYRRHGNNYSFTSERSAFSLFDKVNHRIQMLYHVYNR